MKNFVKEFREFIMRGNVVDMAIGIVIGGAFKSIIDSVIKDIFNPILGYALAGVNFSKLSIILKAAEGETPPVAILYGNLIQTIVSFLLTAFILFLFIKAYNRLKRKQAQDKTSEEAVPATPPAPTETELLQEILSELKSHK